VHGGQDFVAPVIITPAIKQKLSALVALAPLHQPYNLELIDIIQKIHPDLTQIACFDTAFHAAQPWLAKQYALPRALSQQHHIQRYGFHGISYEYITRVLPKYLDTKDCSRVVVAHLGSGASVCAIRGGKSVATSMGFTAIDGLMMGSRCGDLDPGAVLYLLQHVGLTAKEIETLLYVQSGLKGVSGISADMRQLHESNAAEAKEAIDLFCYVSGKELGSMIAVLGGVDALVFTGGIGAYDAIIRQKICDYFSWLGCTLNTKENDTHQCCISAIDSAIGVYALPTDEEKMMAVHATTLLKKTA
jgi:acetate kinase